LAIYPRPLGPHDPPLSRRKTERTSIHLRGQDRGEPAFHRLPVGHRVPAPRRRDNAPTQPVDFANASSLKHNSGLESADPAPVLPDLRIDQLPKVCFEAFVCPLLIRAHQTRVARHIGGEDRSEAADRRHCSPSIRCRNQLYFETPHQP
jgi:hypothetical protein